jgi:hypothetical protein
LDGVLARMAEATMAPPGLCVFFSAFQFACNLLYITEVNLENARNISMQHQKLFLCRTLGDFTVHHLLHPATSEFRVRIEGCRQQDLGHSI